MINEDFKPEAFFHILDHILVATSSKDDLVGYLQYIECPYPVE